MRRIFSCRLAATAGRGAGPANPTYGRNGQWPDRSDAPLLQQNHLTSQAHRLQQSNAKMSDCLFGIGVTGSA